MNGPLRLRLYFLLIRVLRAISGQMGEVGDKQTEEDQVDNMPTLYMNNELSDGTIVQRWKITPLAWDAEPLDVLPPYDLMKCSRCLIFPVAVIEVPE